MKTLEKKQEAMRRRRQKHSGPVAKSLDPFVRARAQGVLGLYLKWAEGWSDLRLAQYCGWRIEDVQKLIDDGFPLVK
jgi:hypothetical protein